MPIDKLKEICDLVISEENTLHWVACEQKPSIITGTPRYFHKNLNLNCCKNKIEYFSLLKDLKKIKKPDVRSRDIAKKILFFYENGIIRKPK